MNSFIKFSTCICCWLFLAAITTSAQTNNRVSEHNQIGWYNYFGTFKFAKKWSLHTEYQWRRTHFIRHWEQSLLRTGINYQLHPKVQARVGYAWAETYPYSQTPINSYGKQFTEHRTYQMLTLTDKIERVELSHRFMLEQRWLGKYTNPNLVKEDTFLFANRLRYMFRAQMPLNHNKMSDHTLYAAAYGEVFIGFGKNVNANVFDQNRFGLLLGYKLNALLKIEAGYLNQIVQLGRTVNNKHIFQYNNGFIINLMFNVDFSKQADVPTK